MQMVSFQKVNLKHDLTKGVVLGTILFTIFHLQSSHSFTDPTAVTAWIAVTIYSILFVALFERYFRDPEEIPNGDTR